MTQRQSVTFVYPSKNIGGAQFLFCRLAKEISSYSTVDVQFIDYIPEGFCFRELSESPEIGVIDYQQGLISLRDTVVIASAFHLPLLRMMLGSSVFDPKNNVSFLFWSIHPDNVTMALQGGLRRFVPNLSGRKEIFRKVALNGHLIFMDGANLDAFESAVGHISPQQLMPVPVSLPVYKPIKRPQYGKFCICWVGRLGSDKVHSVEKIIRDISKSRYKAVIVFKVVGGGSGLHHLEQLAAQLDVNLEVSGYIQGNDLHNMLRRDVDLGLSMGTSCLEIASLGIPSALIDYSHAEIPDSYKYDWIFNTKSFDLGRDVKLGFERPFSLDGLISQVYENDQLGLICYNYVAKHHDIKTVAIQLMNKVELIRNSDTKGVTEADILSLLPISVERSLVYVRRIIHLFRKYLKY